MSARAIRVALVPRGDGALPYPRLDECALEVVADVGSIDDLLRAPAHEHEVAIVGATRAQLEDRAFAARLLRLARAIPTVLVPTRITRNAAATAAYARVAGLAAAGCAPDELTRTVRAVAHGDLAYPSEALALVLRLVQPVAPARA